MNVLTKTTELAMEITLQYVREGDYVIDATCGNATIRCPWQKQLVRVVTFWPWTSREKPSMHLKN